MQVATGKSILNGIAIGPLRIYKKVETQTSQTSTLTPAEKWDRFQSACGKAKEQLAGLYDKALNEVGEDNAAIFEIHQMMPEDEDYLDAVKGVIETQSATAEYAATSTGENFAAALDDQPAILVADDLTPSETVQIKANCWASLPATVPVTATRQFWLAL